MRAATVLDFERIILVDIHHQVLLQHRIVVPIRLRRSADTRFLVQGHFIQRRARTIREFGGYVVRQCIARRIGSVHLVSVVHDGIVVWLEVALFVTAMVQAKVVPQFMGNGIAVDHGAKEIVGKTAHRHDQIVAAKFRHPGRIVRDVVEAPRHDSVVEIPHSIRREVCQASLPEFRLGIADVAIEQCISMIDFISTLQHPALSDINNDIDALRAIGIRYLRFREHVLQERYVFRRRPAAEIFVTTFRPHHPVDLQQDILV